MTHTSMRKKITLLFLTIGAAAVYGQTDLEDHFNLCLEFGAPQKVVELFQPFRTYKAETNGTISHVVKEDASLLDGRPYSEYQIWYTIDDEEGLYQSSLYIRGEKAVLQNILTSYLKKFSALHGEPVYTNLDNGGLLIFWYDEETFIVKARLLLDIVNPYKFVSITFCSPYARHARFLRTLYNGSEEDTVEDENIPPPLPAGENGENYENKAAAREDAGTSTESGDGVEVEAPVLPSKPVPGPDGTQEDEAGEEGENVPNDEPDEPNEDQDQDRE